MSPTPISLPGRPDLLNIRRLDTAIIPYTRACQRYGMRVDMDGMAALSSKFDANMERIEGEIGRLLPPGFLDRFTGETFNVDSAEQVGELLFDVLGVGKGKALKMTPSGDRISTGKKQLELLKGEHPIIPLVLEYRENSKLKSTYSTGMVKMAVRHPKGERCGVCGRRHYSEEWRLHPELTITRTGTGRLACKNPNLQTIPTRSAMGREIRANFFAGEGRTLISCDFSQIELRVLAHCAREAGMIEVFQKPDGDIHLATAMDVFGLKAEEVDKMEHRLPAKTINFAVCVAGGQRVLTPRGMVEIRDLTCHDRVWDGIDWVQHDGVIFKGWQKVINYDGIWATPEHRAWLSNGGVLPISEAMAKGLRLAVTACEDRPIRYGNDTLEEYRVKGKVSLRDCWMFKLWEGLGYYYRQYTIWKTTHMPVPPKQEIPEPPAGQAVDAALLGNETTLRVSILSWLRRLWGKGDQERVWLNRGVRQLRFERTSTSNIQGSGHRENRQRRALRTGEPGITNTLDKPEKYSKECVGGLQRKEGDCHRPLRLSESGLCGIQSKSGKDTEAGVSGSTLARDPEKSSTETLEAEGTSGYVIAPVYDVVNAGPHHRFTVEGKLVSNCYGLSATGLQLGMALSGLYWDTDKCQGFIDSWFAKRPGVQGYMDEQHYHCRRYGFVWDLGGRVRLTPESSSALRKVIEAGLRQAGNMRIQGTAACLMKIALIRLMEEVMPRFAAAGVDAVPLMSIHDEVIFESSLEHADVVAEVIEETMNGVLDGVMIGSGEGDGDEGFRVPILCDYKIGERWKK